MTGGSFDPDVAEANGFRIVTDEAGTRSEPVTAEAQALVAESSSASTFDSAVGNCGHAWLNGSKGNLDTVNFTTGYSVRLPVQGHQWRVQAAGFITSGEKNYAQGAGPGVWSTHDSTVAIGPGFAIVPAFSPVAMAILVDGEECYSGGPSFTFG
ncbi:hypothetical protein C5C55_08705 [Rathayibacter sp. AY1C2]|nr:hypothetical protein C5C55_08705 [Rathayibacter sp. AY1C2]